MVSASGSLKTDCIGGCASGLRSQFNVDPGKEHATALCANISETVLVLLINEQGEKEKGSDEREFSWFCFFSKLGCPGTERRRAWRAEAEWSGSPSGRRSGADLAA